ncbi:MAG: putative ski2-type helicase [Methanomassiliicoccales archaeon PtaU1.Bin124]|nr:MAG: putative ski2-type helicase [Methanomassiliicoccales archaeon PtaU1.Bin124]
MKVSELDVPEGVAEVLRQDGIEDLYPPQATAAPIALSGKNLVLAVPTASGKSLIGYLAVARQVLQKGGKALYIVPLRALASEKFEDLKKFEPLGIRTAMSVGDFDQPDPQLEKADVIVATSEKADSLLRHKTSWLGSINLVVADEVHLINDPDRGPTLEVTLAKFRKYNPNIQIIALSATVRNSRELADWLDAEHINNTWRPVKLKEGVYLDNLVRFTDNSKKTIPFDEDPVWSLVKDSIDTGGQCLVFVNTRKSTETLAVKFTKFMKDRAASAPDDAELKAMDADENGSMAKSLRACLKKGVAFHHAGLTNEQRRFVEQNFKKGRVKAIVATPTLAAGINLPARRVIIREVQRYEEGGYVPIPVMEIKQMCGRAGRPRYDKEGEAIVVARNEDDASFLFENYLLAESEDIYSKLGNEAVLRSHILSTIATETVSTWDGLMQFLASTFFAHQTRVQGIEEVAQRIIEFLMKEEMLRELNGRYEATFFGKRVSDMYIDPVTAVRMRESLRRYRPGMGHFGFLHAICSTPDMLNMYTRRNDSQWLDDLIEKRAKDLLCDIPEMDEEYEYFRSEFKTAVTLDEWINETDEEKILEVMGIGPGDLRSKVELAKWLIYSMREMSNMFNSDTYPALTELMLRMEHGVRQQLLDLVKLKGVGRVRARALFAKGLVDRAALRRTDMRQLAAIHGIGETLAQSIKKQVGEATADEAQPGPTEETKEQPRSGQTKLFDF